MLTAEGLAPLLDFLESQGDPAHADAYAAALKRQFPLDSPFAKALDAAIRAGHGSICTEVQGRVRYGSVVKPKDAGSRGFRANMVDMDSAGGPESEHTHTRGEITFAVTLEGNPTFDGIPAVGWIVLPVGSRHIPTVKGGRAIFLYFWPGGKAEFHFKAS